jgi:ABC-type Mn2+/Zn2+ transport system permease subunit
VAAVAIALAGRLPEIGRDTATAVVITGLFGLGVLLALSPEVPARLQELLFGDVLATSAHDLVVSAALVVVVLAVLAVAHPRLAAVGFDRMSARALGVRVGAVDVVLLALLAVVVLVATKGLGNLLVVSVLVAPAVAAQRVTRRLGPMLAVSAGVAVLGGVVGLQVSYHADTAAGASIALSLVALAAVAAAGSSLARRAYA